MSLALPGHLASSVVNDGIARAVRSAAGICLAAALLLFSLLRVGSPSPASAGLFAGILLSGLSLAALESRRSVATASIYTLAGAITTGLAVVVSTDFPDDEHSAARAVVVMLWVSAILVGGPGRSRWAGLAWTAAGLLGSTVGVCIGSAILGAPPLMSAFPFEAAAVVVVFFLTTGAAGGERIRQVLPEIHRATREEKLAEVRSGVEMRAAALLHDTVLGSLAAIANGAVGPLSKPLAATIESDLDTIIGQDWTERIVPKEVPPVRGTLALVLDEEREAGLTITVTGDPGRLDLLPAPVVTALSLAVKQLLVNVRQHSGTSVAEVVVMGYPDSLSLMVVDGGRGFDPDAVDGHRLGIRNSVVGRLEDVGGTVRIWSADGRGTSVLLSVPVAPAVSDMPIAPDAPVTSRLAEQRVVR